MMMRTKSAEVAELICIRFWLVAIIGGTLATFGIFANAILTKLFVSSTRFRHSPFFFLGFVALFDTLLDAVYLFLQTPPVLIEYLDMVWLYSQWVSHATWLYPLGQTFKIASVFCLVIASFERYVITSHWTFSGFDYRTRWLILAFMLFVAVTIRFFISVEVTGVVSSTSIVSSSTNRHPNGHQMPRKEWLANFLDLLTVIIPFGTLVFFNGGIVLMLRHQNVQQLRSLITELTMGHDFMKVRRRNIRAATNTLLLIISIYLISNLLGLFLSVAEYISPGYLQKTYPYHYRLGSDCASLLTVFGNALRFPAHVYSNKEVREQFRLMFCQQDKLNQKKMSIVELEGHLQRANTVLKLRRFSERIENPWFTAIIATTPRLGYENENGNLHATAPKRKTCATELEEWCKSNNSGQANGKLENYRQRPMTKNTRNEVNCASCHTSLLEDDCCCGGLVITDRESIYDDYFYMDTDRPSLTPDTSARSRLGVEPTLCNGHAHKDKKAYTTLDLRFDAKEFQSLRKDES